MGLRLSVGKTPENGETILSIGYISFNSIRQLIAEAWGGSFPPHRDRDLDEHQFYVPDGATSGSSPGLFEFLGHSDCNGEISPEKCGLLASELIALAPEIEKASAKYDKLAYFQIYAPAIRKIIDGCQEAADGSCYLFFS